MAHLLRSVLYPNGEPSRAAQVGSSSSSNPDLGRRFPTGSSSGGAGVQSAQPNRSTYNNPPVYFTQDPEVEEAAPSVFVADSILRGFDLNNAAPETSSAPESSAAGKFVPGPHSGQAGSAASVAQDYDEEILSQPMVPYVGLTFDDIEEAKEVYNNYAYKLGFGTHIGNTKYSTARHAPKGTILSRVFECVHAGKPFDGTAKTARSNSEGFVATDMSSFSAQKSKGKQAKEQMDVKDTRQRNIVLRHDCKAHMVVGMRAGVWTVTVFNAEHTHPMVSMVGRRRFYRSHRKVPEEDFQLLQTLHNQNISTSKIMGALADVRGGDVRGLPYVKRDVSNIRTMLREAVTLRDVSLTVEYFERRKAENPNFFYATQLDENNAVRALFWVDGRTRSLYHKYKDCVFFDTTFCTNRWSIEKQAVLFYTREVFDRFQKMLQMSTGFYPLRTELEELCFDLVPNPGLDVRTYRVQVGLEEETYTCGCNQFEMCGLICPHIIRVIVHMNVRSIPEKYMLHRWSMAATTPVPDPGSTGGKFGVPVNNTLKYNSLCRKLNSLAADSCIADDTYAIVLDMVDEAKKVVAAMHRARIAGQQGQGEEHGDATDPRSSNVHHEQQQHGSNLNQQQQEQPVAHETPSNSNLRNPTRVKPKGRPKEKEQRRKPLVELRDEANKKRKKKAEEPKVMKEPKPKRQYRKKKCPFCNEEGHTLKECEYMVLAKQFKDAKDSQPEKTV
ncbi:hypothetical protein QYE76_044487 [Lolium multiflorum]|nr:hypothetical protein QYE76_035024 [Lolium multiflorum]KAK1683639.1 hypothetical protein QYE76_044487 [Lolium multiflorum]